MAAQYLVRFDDLCPAMNWRVWRQVEQVLDAHGVKPLVAVVPDNQDAELNFGPAVEDFWVSVREWQSRGWAIGLHGYQHLYVTADAGIVGRNGYSEFAGLSEIEQRRKIEGGLEIFRRHGIQADVWIAPAHSFDATTVRVLAEAGVDCISDGYSMWPYRAAGQLWIPQQMARFRRMPAGVWTICFHVNRWTEVDIRGLDQALTRFTGLITTVAALRSEYAGRRLGRADRAMDVCIRTLRGLRQKKRGSMEGGAACTSHS